MHQHEPASIHLAIGGGDRALVDHNAVSRGIEGRQRRGQDSHGRLRHAVPRYRHRLTRQCDR